MAVYAELFDGTRLEFPDGTDPSVISATAKRVTATLSAKQQPDPSGAVPDELGRYDAAKQNAPQSAGFSAKDTALALGQGVVGAGKSLADVFGADNAASQALGDVSKGMAEQYSPERKAEMARREQLQKQASKGTIGDEISTFLGGVAEAPVQSLAQGLGSIVPYVGTGIIGGIAKLGGATVKAINTVMGAAQGAGAVKGSLYDGVKQELEKSGMKPEEAAAKAAKAQEYLGENFLDIAGGAALGGIGARVGVENMLTPGAAAKLDKRLVSRMGKAALAEAPLEGAQGGQEQLAINRALQKQGYDVGTFEGVAGSAARDAAVGALTGSAVGVRGPAAEKVVEPPPTTPPTPPGGTPPPLTAPTGGSQDTQAMIDEFQGRPPAAPIDATTPPVTPPSTPPTEITPSTEPLSNVWESIQNRDRSTPASVAQMAKIANEPDYSRVSMSRDYGTGAPIVAGAEVNPAQVGRTDVITGADGKKVPVQYAVIESGEVIPSHNADGTKNPAYVDQNIPAFRAITNGRVAGLQAAYNQGTAEGYKADLMGDDLHGIDKNVIQGMKNPMLVRVMPMDQVNKNTGDVSNTGAGLSFNVVEQAKNDTNRIDLAKVSFNDAGDITPQTVQDFIKAMPDTERGNLIDKQGNPTKQAIERVDAAVFQQAYGNDKLTELAFQAQDEEARNIVRALNMAASKAIRLGDSGDYDVRPLVNEAVELAINARRNNISLSDAAKQVDMTANPLANNIIQMFADNPRSAKAIGENLSNLFDNAYNEGSKEGADMFGEVPKRPVDQLIKESFAKKTEPDLFEAEKATRPTENQEEPAQFKSKKSMEEIAKDIDGMTKGSEIAQYLVDTAPNAAAKAIAERTLFNIKAIEDSGVPVVVEVLQGSKRKSWFGSSALVDGGTKKIKYFKVEYNGLNAKGQAETFPGSKDDLANIGMKVSRTPTGTRYSTLLHEMLHVISQVQLDALIKRNYKGPDKIIYNELRSIYNAVKDQIEQDRKNLPREQWHPLIDQVGSSYKGSILKDIHELFVRTLSEKDVQSYLSGVKMGKKTALTKLMEIFRKVIGLNPDYQSALDRMMIVSEQIFAQTPADMKRLAQTEGFDFPTMKEEPWYDRDTPNKFGREIALTDFYKKMENSYDEFSSPDEAYEAAYEDATSQEKAILRQLQKENFLGFDYPHQAIQAIIEEPENFELTTPLKAAISRLGNKVAGVTSSKKEEVGKEDDYEIVRKEMYRGRTTPDVTWELRKKSDNKLINTFKNKKEAQQMLDIYTLSQDEVWKKYPELKPKYEEVAEDVDKEKPTATARNYLGKQIQANWAFPEDNVKHWPGMSDESVDNFIYKIQDKQIDTKRAQQAIEKAAGEIEDNLNVYDKEQLYHGRTATGIREFLLNELMPAIKDLGKLKLTPQDLKTYLHNRHAKERNDKMNEVNKLDPITGKERETPWELQDRASGIATKDAKAYLDNLDPAKKTALEKVAKQFDDMVKQTQNILVASGAEDQATVDAWNDTYEFYVPLFRVEDDFTKAGGFGPTGASKGFGTRGAFSKRAMGSEKEVQDILGNLIAQRERALIRSEKIKVGKALYGLALMNPNPDLWLPVNPDAIKSKEALIAELQGLGFDDAATIANNLMQEPKSRYISKEKKQFIDPETGLPVQVTEESVKLKIDNLKRFGDNVFPIRINGKDRYIFFNKNNPQALRMVHSLMNLDADALGDIEGIIGKATRWFASVNTQYNPIFGAVNLIRDVGGANFNLTTTPIAGEQAKVTKGVIPAMRGILNVLRDERKGKTDTTGKWAQAFQEFRKEGGQTGYRDSLIRTDEEKQVIEKELNKMKSGNAKKAFSAVMGALSDFNDMMENSVRVSAYVAARDKGLSKQQAAIVAKNLTVNFDKKGQLSARVNAYYAFFNASIQGTARLAQTLKGPKGKAIIGGGIMLGAAQAVLLAAAGYRDDEPPEFIRQRNFVIPLPDGKFISIPYPLGLHLLPNIGRITTEFVLSGGKKPAKKVGDLIGATADAFSPIGSSGLSLQTILPTVADPLAALEANKDAFGRPIYKKDQATNPTPGYMRSRENSSEVSKQISYFLNLASGGSKYSKGFISPTADEIDYVVGQVTGGVGRELMKTEQTIKGAITGEETPAYKKPLVGRFYGETQSNAAESARFYNNIIRMAEHENEVKGRMKDKEPVAPYLRDHPEARFWKMANTTENQINALNKQKKEFIEKKLPEDRIKRVENQKVVIMKRFNDHIAKFEE